MRQIENGRPNPTTVDLKHPERGLAQRTDVTPELLRYTHLQHKVRLDNGHVEVPRSFPAPTGDERLQLIDKGISMRIAPGEGFTPSEFVGITDIAVRLSTRENVSGLVDDEALSTFPRANGAEIRIHHSFRGEGVNVVFVNPEGTPTKRIVVGQNFSESVVDPDSSPKDFIKRTSPDSTIHVLDGVIIFDETNPQLKRTEPLSAFDAKFVGIELFKAALTREEQKIAEEDALISAPLTDSLQQLVTRNS